MRLSLPYCVSVCGRRGHPRPCLIMQAPIESSNSMNNHDQEAFLCRHLRSRCRHPTLKPANPALCIFVHLGQKETDVGRYREEGNEGWVAYMYRGGSPERERQSVCIVFLRFDRDIFISKKFCAIVESFSCLVTHRLIALTSIPHFLLLYTSCTTQ